MCSGGCTVCLGRAAGGREAGIRSCAGQCPSQCQHAPTPPTSTSGPGHGPSPSSTPPRPAYLTRARGEQAEAGWAHWQRDRMRQLISELTLKRPTDEWRLRMERIQISLELSDRDNARLRAELSRIAGPQEGDNATSAAAAAISGGGAVSELLNIHETLQTRLKQAEDALQQAQRRSASQESYLLTLQVTSLPGPRRRDPPPPPPAAAPRLPSRSLAIRYPPQYALAFRPRTPDPGPLQTPRARVHFGCHYSGGGKGNYCQD